MKKYFYSLFAAAALILSATSCSQEEDFPGGNGQEVDVTFAVKTSDATATRTVGGVTVGKGQMANHLIYAVYKSGTEEKSLIQNKVVDSDKDGKFEVTVPLVKGIPYDIVFFAYNEEGNAFGIDATNARDIDLQNLELDPKKLSANKEAYDAFFAFKDNYKAGAVSETVYLNRPFAQLNVGTTKADLANAADLDVRVAQSKVAVKGFSKFNARTGEATNETELVYALSDVLKADKNFQATSDEGVTADFTNEIFNVSSKVDDNGTLIDYAYLSLAYILAPADGYLKEVSVSFFQEGAADAFNTITVPSLKLQRNWRTNIIGNLLTSSNSFEVVIDAEFDGDHNSEVWDGYTTKQPGTNEATDTYIITTASEFAWLSGKTLDKNVELAADIDMGGYAFQGMIGNSKTFDGKYFTISNVIFDYQGKQPWSSMFVTGGGGNGAVTAKSFTLNNVIVAEAYNKNGFMGNGAAVVAYAEGTTTIENVTVKNSNIASLNKVGAIVGYATSNSDANLTVKNCHVYNTTVSTELEGGEGQVGGLIGYVQGNTTIENCSVENSTVKSNMTSESKTFGKFIGTFHGSANTLTVTNSSVDNVTVEGLDETAKKYTSPYGDFLGGWRLDGGTVTINGVTITKDADSVIDTVGEFNTAVTNASDGDVIAFKGTIVGANLNSGKDLTIVGLSEDATLDASTISSYVTVSGDVTFKNLTFKFDSSRDYQSNGINSSNSLKFEACAFEGLANVMNGTFTYDKCTFTNTVEGKYPAWVYSNGKVVYNDCTFTGVDRAAKVYSEANYTETNVTYNNCVFKATKANKAAVEVDASNLTTTHVVVTINNAKIENMGVGEDYGNSQYFNLEHSNKGNGIVTIDGETHACVSVEAALLQALKMDSKKINVLVLKDIDCYLSSGIAGANTTEVNIAGLVQNENKPVLNITCPSASYNGSYCTFRTNNPNAVMKFADITLDKIISGNTWNTYNMEFYTDVELNNCVVNHPVTFCTKATATGTTFDVDGTTHNQNTFYTIWQQANGTVVTLDNCVVKGNRGIKVDEEYVTAAATQLKVNNTTFDLSGTKPAILVKSSDKVDINLSGVDITKVSADQNYEVWVDEDAAEYADLVTVTGGDMKIEGDGYRKASDNLYVIWNADGMKWFANEVNTNENTFKGKTVKLVADIDLNNEVWTPVGQTGATYFQGTFDGQSHTIKNLNVDSESQTSANYSSGLFGWGEANGFTVKNVTVDGARVKGHHNVGVIVGYYYGTVDNCHVKNATLSCTKANDDANGDKCGAIAGYVGEATSKLTNCTAVDCSISAGRDAGQIAGAAVSSVVVNCSATRVAVTSNGTSTGANIRNEVIGRVL